MSVATRPTDQAAAPSSPRTLFGYDVLGTIGHGAGSTIYCVSHPASKQLYALKYVVRKVEKDDRFIDQLQAEFEVGAKVNHPHLRRSVDFQVNRTGLLRRVATDAALVLELFDGTSLEQHTPRDLASIVNAFIQTAQALHALHGLGYVHCDLKPNNILRDPATGTVKVIDLGQAAKIGTAKPRVQGTPDYMAPEQVKLQPVTVKTDVYNFGATLYFCLAGKKLPTLFTIKKGDNSFLVDQQIESPRDLNPLVPETLSNLVMECVRTNPAKRPGDMGELARKLEIIEFVMEQQQDPKRQAAAAVEASAVDRVDDEPEAEPLGEDLDIAGT
jgi:eukaryotic-like serine/threonine-protein kinase